MTKLCDRVLKTAGIRVQSSLECNDPAYRVCSRIVEDITTVSPSEANWKDGDPVDEAVAEICARIAAALPSVEKAAGDAPAIPSPREKRQRQPVH